MDRDISKEEVLDLFKQGFDCSQVVLMAFAGELGYDEDEAARMAAGFGGGMFRGDTCGAVTGALIALGIRYGHSEPNNRDTKGELVEKVSAFQQEYASRTGSLLCRELVPFDFSKEGQIEEAQASGKLYETCPDYVMTSIDILKGML